MPLGNKCKGPAAKGTEGPCEIKAPSMIRPALGRGCRSAIKAEQNRGNRDKGKRSSNRSGDERHGQESCNIFEHYTKTTKEVSYKVRNALLNPHLILKFRKTNFTKNDL